MAANAPANNDQNPPPLGPVVDGPVDDAARAAVPLLPDADLRTLAPALQRELLQLHPMRIGQVSHITAPDQPGGPLLLIVRDGPTGVEVTGVQVTRMAAYFPLISLSI